MRTIALAAPPRQPLCSAVLASPARCPGLGRLPPKRTLSGRPLPYYIITCGRPPPSYAAWRFAMLFNNGYFVDCTVCWRLVVLSTYLLLLLFIAYVCMCMRL